jgi:hypothetical protein
LYGFVEGDGYDFVSVINRAIVCGVYFGDGWRCIVDGEFNSKNDLNWKDKFTLQNYESIFYAIFYVLEEKYF